MAAVKGIAVVHELKAWPQYFLPIWQGRKSFEVRRDDRGFQEGDTLCLREWEPDSQQYTGAEIHAAVTFVLRDFPGLQPGYVVLGLANTTSKEEAQARLAASVDGDDATFLAQMEHWPIVKTPEWYRLMALARKAATASGAITVTIKGQTYELHPFVGDQRRHQQAVIARDERGGYVVAEVVAVHTWDCVANRWGRRNHDKPCKCGAADLTSIL